MLPVFPLMNVREAELPVLVRLVDALEEASPLFALREVEEDLDDPGSIAVEMLLQINDGTIPLLPNGPLIDQLVRKALAAKNFRVHPNDEDFLIVGSIEDADSPPFRQMASGAPEKIVLQFLGTRLFETEDFAALRVNAGHYVPDGAILARRVHPLKHQQQGIAAGGVVEVLQRTQSRDVLVQEFLIALLCLAIGMHHRRPLSKFDLCSG